MSGQRYPEEFKIEAVKQVTDRGHPVADVAERLGVTTHSIYNWLKKYGPKAAEFEAKSEEEKKIKALEKELKRITEERDILTQRRCESHDWCTWTTRRFRRTLGNVDHGTRWFYAI